MRRLPSLSSLLLRLGSGNRVGALMHATRFRIYGMNMRMNVFVPPAIDQTEPVHY
jgi:hypothetical protein